MSRPRVSVVIPTRDRSELLRRAVGSVVAQTIADDVEIIVVDDGSTATERQAMERWLPREVQVIRHETSTGVSVARNDGIDAARGEWVAFLDDDDVWAPDKLERQLAAAEAAGATFVCTGAVAVDQALTPQRLIVPPAGQAARDELLEHNAVGTPSSVLCRREVAASGRFDPTFSVLADWDAWLAMTRDATVAVCPEPLMAYVVHEGNLHTADIDGMLDEFEALRRKHAGGADAGGVEFGGHQWWGWVGSAARRAGQRRLALRSYARAFRRRPCIGYLLRAGLALLGSFPVPFRPAFADHAAVAWLDEAVARAEAERPPADVTRRAA